MSSDAAVRTIPSHPSSSLANIFTVLRKKLLLGPATPEILSKRLLDVVLFVHLDVDDVTSEEAKCYRLFEVQLSRGISQISIIGPDFVISLDFVQPFWEVIQIAFILLLSCFLRQVSLYQQLVSFVALHVILLSLFLLLGDNLWTGGMNGVEVTCNNVVTCSSSSFVEVYQITGRVMLAVH